MTKSLSKSKKPNLIFIFTDEQRFDTFGEASGNLQMPNLTSLAEHATVFERTYCASPVCTPSRGSMLTGFYLHVHGAVTNNVPLDPKVKCLPEYLKDSDYETAYVGKWHLGDEIFSQHGFSHWVSIEDEYIPWYSDHRDKNLRSSYYHFLESQGVPRDGEIYSRDYCARLPEELGKPYFVASQAIEFIENHQTDPFVLYINFIEPHMPFFGPRDHQYSLEEVSLPENSDAPQHSRWEKCLAQLCYQHGESGLPLKNSEDWKVMVRNYWGLNSLVDTQLGRIIQKLKDLYLYDSSLIVFTSDHGDMMGSHKLIAKQVMYEESARVPMVVKFPGQSEARRIGQPVSQIHLVPTLLEALGETIEEGTEKFHGESLFNEIQQHRIVPRDVLISWYPPEEKNIHRLLFQGKKFPIYPTRTSHLPESIHFQGLIIDEDQARAIPEYLLPYGSPQELLEVFTAHRRALISRDGAWKLILSTDGDKALFDLIHDPGEWKNVLDDNPEVYKLLFPRLIQELKKVEDPMLEAFVTLY